MNPECSAPKLWDHKIFTELLEFTDTLLKKHGIKYWLDCGTLLGAVRYGEHIKWDYDVDTSILDTDSDKLLTLK